MAEQEVSSERRSWKWKNPLCLYSLEHEYTLQQRTTKENSVFGTRVKFLISVAFSATHMRGLRIKIDRAEVSQAAWLKFALDSKFWSMFGEVQNDPTT